ncbi:hypothetical protein BU24DRAFT_428734 [Aaosphaeria arxii CBS 175.79]|uniref:Uncharacterized protein n=1 Tax=Aaosphaeria arxii CBS 175.79 TaxID=1450172 RepID=A0A6A5X8R5_9PLEO|nr:uncharacterized protein BU24DRAFT_428734 [Aaosphaeria arxii CBS 175.79]KAF2009197.1 hypothetical protein BU24DRAFT_428734 [Aaosphaeria arxii CBS 175.79]
MGTGPPVIMLAVLLSLDDITGNDDEVPDALFGLAEVYQVNSFKAVRCKSFCCGCGCAMAMEMEMEMAMAKAMRRWRAQPRPLPRNWLDHDDHPRLVRLPTSLSLSLSLSLSPWHENATVNTRIFKLFLSTTIVTTTTNHHLSRLSKLSSDTNRRTIVSIIHARLHDSGRGHCVPHTYSYKAENWCSLHIVTYLDYFYKSILLV